MSKSKGGGNEGRFTEGVLRGGFIFYLILGRFLMFPLPASPPLPLSCLPCHHAPTALVLALIETAARTLSNRLSIQVSHNDAGHKRSGAITIPRGGGAASTSLSTPPAFHLPTSSLRRVTTLPHSYQRPISPSPTRLPPLVHQLCHAPPYRLPPPQPSPQ
jgi:hypothetical protein